MQVSTGPVPVGPRLRGAGGEGAACRDTSSYQPLAVGWHAPTEGRGDGVPLPRHIAADYNCTMKRTRPVSLVLIGVVVVFAVRVGAQENPPVEVARWEV